MGSVLGLTVMVGVGVEEEAWVGVGVGGVYRHFVRDTLFPFLDWLSKHEWNRQPLVGRSIECLAVIKRNTKHAGWGANSPEKN